MIITIFLILLLTSCCSARPWEIQQLDTPYTGVFVPHLIREVDSWAASLLSQSQVPLVGAGAALAYIGYAGAMLLTGGEVKPPAISPRSANESTDILSGVTSVLVQEAVARTESAVAFRRAGGRALQHGAIVLRRALNAFSRTVGALYSTLSTGRKALGTNCVAERLCRVGQLTSWRWPILGVLLRSLDSADLDEYARALIDGTTIGDCSAIYPICSE